VTTVGQPSQLRWLPWQTAAAAAQRGGRLQPSLEKPWGIWDQHTQEWVVVDLETEQDATAALLTVESTHPWELVVREDRGGFHGEPGWNEDGVEDW